MNKTPQGNRTYIGIFGKRNGGKSSLLNAITERKISLVSSIGGTTTDPVKKAMELIPYGPVVFIDTAGLDDSGELGSLRKQRTKEMFSQIDLALIVHDINDIDREFEGQLIRELSRLSVPYMVVISKIDTAPAKQRQEIQSIYKEAVFLSAHDRESMLKFKTALVEKLSERKEKETLVGDLLPYGSHVECIALLQREIM